jgi:hypothetical protein
VQAIAALIPYAVLIYTQEAVFAFTDPEGVKIVDRLSHGKCGAALLPMHFLNEAKTCLKFELQSLKCFKLLLHQRLYCQRSSRDTLLLDPAVLSLYSLELIHHSGIVGVTTPRFLASSLLAHLVRSG